MKENNNNFEQEHDSLKEVAEYQDNMYNPGHYVATGKVPPTVSAPGNATPLVMLCFFAAALFLTIGLLLFFSDIHITSFGTIASAIASRVIVLVVMVAISLFFLIFGFVYLKKAKKYYREKAALEKEPIDETVEDKLMQRTCPQCGRSHDIDFPKCPDCGQSF